MRRRPGPAAKRAVACELIRDIQGSVANANIGVGSWGCGVKEAARLNRSGLAWLAGMALLLATGCAVDQAREVQTYRDVLDAGQTQPLEPFSPGESLSLKRALALANANNEQLAGSGEDYLQALIDKDRAFARFLPTIRFAPSYMRQEKSSYATKVPWSPTFCARKPWMRRCRAVWP